MLVDFPGLSWIMLLLKRKGEKSGFGWFFPGSVGPFVTVFLHLDLPITHYVPQLRARNPTVEHSRVAPTLPGGWAI